MGRPSPAPTTGVRRPSRRWWGDHYCPLACDGNWGRFFVLVDRAVAGLSLSKNTSADSVPGSGKRASEAHEASVFAPGKFPRALSSCLVSCKTRPQECHPKELFLHLSCEPNDIHRKESIGMKSFKYPVFLLQSKGGLIRSCCRFKTSLPHPLLYRSKIHVWRLDGRLARLKSN